MTAAAPTCSRCGQHLQRLMRPLSRLRWSRYWWKGFKSLFTGPLWICNYCGAMYANDGSLLAAGAVATDAERRLDTYRRDMATLRDAFAGIIIAAELVAVWLIGGAESVAVSQLVATVTVGAAAVVPFAYFARKAHVAKRDLKQLRAARRGSSLAAGDRD